jgi:hypothetical protein
MQCFLKKYEKYASWIFLGLMVLCLVPMAVMGFFNHPIGDDFDYGRAAMQCFRENGNLLERINVGSLSPSSSQTYSCMIPKTMFANGENTITLKVDATDKVEEYNEYNNEWSTSFNVNNGYGRSYAPENPALTAWDVRGYEDMNKDGFADLLLGNESDLSSWEDPGEAKITALCRELPGNGWEFAGVADFNGDGSKEILLYGGNETFKPDSDEKGKIFMPIA